ncbi:unnamed protein product, partial [Durusdinium trenchii]
ARLNWSEDESTHFHHLFTMGPMKFDDLEKTAKEVLSDDYQTSGYQFKAKQKTSWQGSVVTTAVDLVPGSKDGVFTPSKLTWRLPTPMGCPFFVIDKLEVDKKGGIKLETSTEKAVKGLKIEVKPELSDPLKTKSTLTYTALKDVRLALDTKGIEVKDLVGELTYQPCAAAILGVKFAAPWCPDVGLRATHGPFFASIYAKEMFKQYSLSCHYKYGDNFRVAGSYTCGGKKGGSCALGLMYSCNKNTTMKLKMERDMSVSCALKQSLAKGFTLTGGLKYGMQKGDYTCGLQLSVE